MIVVVGTPSWRPTQPAGPAGRACAIAIAAAGAGAGVELLGRAGEDPAGDALMIGLAQAGVGHIALLRDPARPTPLIEAVIAPADEDDDGSPFAEPADDDDAAAAPGARLPDARGPVLEPADVDLGLRYIPSYGVIVVSDDAPASVIPVAADAAAYAGAALVVVVGEGSPVPDGIPATATVLAAPASDPDDAFARLVGSYAAALDAGADPAAAFDAARGAWEHPAD